MILRFGSTRPVNFYLNGLRVVEETEVEAEEEDVHPHFRHPQTAVMHLRAGENTLVVDTRPSPSERSHWFFGGALLTPEGDLMTDLVFE